MSLKPQNITVFIDFDGTISSNDLGDELFKSFGEFEPHNTNLKKREIGIKEYWHRLCNSLDENLELQNLEEFAENAPIDSYFLSFFKILQDNNIKHYIISDGFDVYIKAFLKKYNIESIKFFSNNLIKTSGGYKPEFPNASDSCNCFSASCKRNLLLGLLPPDSVSIYIGDGYSDFCAAEHSDVIFAKKTLAKYCNENKVPHYNWKSFFDIKKIFEEKILKGKIKIRNDAKVKRKNAFEAE